MVYQSSPLLFIVHFTDHIPLRSSTQQVGDHELEAGLGYLEM